MKICKFYPLLPVALLITGNILFVQQTFSSVRNYAVLNTAALHTPVFTGLNRFNIGIEYSPGNSSATFEIYKIGNAVSRKQLHGTPGYPEPEEFCNNMISVNELNTCIRLHITDSYYKTLTRKQEFCTLTGEHYLKHNSNAPANRVVVNQPNNYYNSRLYILSSFRTRLPSRPVSIISIKAALKNAAVQINWEAREELNLNLYEVERSTDGVNFQTIGLVFPWENPENSSNYRFTDQHPQSGINFYRLRGVDKDGSFKYSDIVRAGNAPLPANAVSIVPNPVKGNIRAVFSGLAKAAYVVELRNVAGILQLKKTINIQQADQLEVLDPGNAAPGVYWLTIFDQQLQKLGSSKVVIR